MLLMIDNYDSFTFNLVQALQAAGEAFAAREVVERLRIPAGFDQLASAGNHLRVSSRSSSDERGVPGHGRGTTRGCHLGRGGFAFAPGRTRGGRRP